MIAPMDVLEMVLVLRVFVNVLLAGPIMTAA